MRNFETEKVAHFALKMEKLHDIYKNILEIMRIYKKVTKKYNMFINKNRELRKYVARKRKGRYGKEKKWMERFYEETV